jgi:hypothetical protein
MSSQVPVPHSSSSADPALLKFTEALTETPDAKTASGIADMLLIFLSARRHYLRGFAGSYPLRDCYCFPRPHR